MTPAQIEDNKKIPGWFNEGDMHALSGLASSITNGTIIELGSMHGRSAFTMSVSSPSSKIFCLDYWGGWMSRTEDNIERPNSIELFKSYTADLINVTPVQLTHDGKTEPIWEEPVDMVFIDTSHTNPDDWNCIEFWLPKIKKGGIICGHDYYHKGNSEIIHYPDVVENARRLEELLGKPVTLHGFNSVWSFII